MPAQSIRQPKDKQPSILLEPRLETDCPLCEDKRRSYLFVLRGLPICQCAGCGLIALSPQPSFEDIASFYGPEWETGEPPPQALKSGTETEAVERYLNTLVERGKENGKILLIAPKGHPFAEAAERRGFTIVRHVSAREIESGLLLEGSLDAAVVLHQLNQVAAPASLLRQIRSLLPSDGVLLLTVPSVESWPRSFFGSQWTEWRPENRYYFSPRILQGLLLKSGFDQVWTEPDRRLYSLEHIYDRAAAFPRTLLTRLILLFCHVTPRPLHALRLRFASSGIIVSATPAVVRERPLCSIVVPVYNEKATVSELLNGLLSKQIRGTDKEVIIVESNSTDGSREIVSSFEGRPGVRILFQERPRGKGNAVRLGLQHARGDIVAIQDADLEYDLNDYDDLVEPLLKYQQAFVLGSRHSGHWKMRQFNDSSRMSTYFNIGHVFFATLINVVYRQRLKDPFTMFKLFWRDCLYGLDFECNRFDFDFELVIKLLRKGYVPIEIPVNYRARSFEEGKKVNPFRDPLTWIWAVLKYRFVPVKRRRFS